MEHIRVNLLDSSANVQYGLNWGQRENRDKNQSYLQLLPEVYNSDFFPVAGKYFIAKTDDNKRIIFTRAQKGKGTALQTPDSNAIIGLYLRTRMGLMSESEITREDIFNYGRLDIDFYKTEEDLTYLMLFDKDWKSLDIQYIYRQYLLIYKICNDWKEVTNHINQLNIFSNNLNNQFNIFNAKKEEIDHIFSNSSSHIPELSDYKSFLQSNYFLSHYGSKKLTMNGSNNINKKDYSHQQIIYYGAPGTGKSHEIKKLTKGEDVIRTTFHPDSDYSTFVGSYKPTTKEVPVISTFGGKAIKVKDDNGNELKEERIVYEFVSQAFLQAYVEAWKKFANAGEAEHKKQFLVIEEINRGNCAQIFGDLFQLLDRNDNGFSEYPIKADTDLKKQLKKLLSGLTIENAEAINALYESDDDVVGKVLDGDVLLLPNNLYIWATMNTSDQSLFPIDSAFKRRWNWKYIPISDHEDKNYKIDIKGTIYDWWGFLEKINQVIGSTTSSEDKKLGYFFCKAKDGVIDAETFVSKVLFYLWNDVFKNYGFDNAIFNKVEKERIAFSDFFTQNGDPNPEMVKKFLKNLDEAINKDKSFKETKEETPVQPTAENSEPANGTEA